MSLGYDSKHEKLCLKTKYWAAFSSFILMWSSKVFLIQQSHCVTSLGPPRSIQNAVLGNNFLGLKSGFYFTECLSCCYYLYYWSSRKRKKMWGKQKLEWLWYASTVKCPLVSLVLWMRKKPGLAAPRARQLFSSAVAEIGQFTSALFCCTLVSTALF